MYSRFSFTTSLAGNFRRAVLVVLAILLAAMPTLADVCVWRDPERTMQKIFPAARDYKTITVKMTPDKIAAIERAINAKLDDSEKNEFNFYDITAVVRGKPQKIGTIVALAGRGEYGVIEVVIGLDGAGKIAGVYIQRSRERVTRALESPAFLQQFKGKSKEDGFDVGSIIKPASADADSASQVVAFVIKKMLVFYDVLSKGESTL